MKTAEGLEITECFAVPGGHNIIDVIHPTSRRGGYSNETLEEVCVRHPGAMIMTLDAWCAAKAAEQDAPVTWTETTEERFNEMLEVLPPAFYGGNAFLVGEPMDHHAGNGRPRFDAYRKDGDKYLSASRPMTIREFREFLGIAKPVPQSSVYSEQN